MSVDLQSKDLYRVSIQTGYDLYSSSVAALDSCLKEMDACKGEWTRGLTDLSVSSFSAKDKEDMANRALLNYHKFMKTREFTTKLFSTLQEIYEDSKRPAIDQDTYTTMIRLGEPAQKFLQEVEALKTCNENVRRLAEKTRLVFKEPMEIRLPQIAHPLNSLLAAIRPDISNWSVNPWATPVLDVLYQEFLNNAPGNTKPYELPLRNDLMSSAPFAPVPSTSQKLHQAHQTLGLIFIEPQTNIAYGAASSEAEESIYTEVQNLFSDIEEMEGKLAFQKVLDSNSESSKDSSLEGESSTAPLQKAEEEEEAAKLFEKEEADKNPEEQSA